MRTLHSLLCTVWLAWLAACGPGTGGTGTGETHSLYLGTFGASAGSVCASTFASALSCADVPVVVGSPPPSATTAGTLVVHFTDHATGGEVNLTIEGNAVHLDARCRGLRFEGDWGIAGVDDARFFGAYGTAAAPSPVPATLAAEALPAAGNALRVTLRQADGRVLLGPLDLVRVTEPVTEAASCR